MAEETRKIEIFRPFGEAYEWMVKMLFRPFNLGKWCVLGFASLLASLAGGFNANFNFSNRRDLHSQNNAIQQAWTTNHFGLGGWFWPVAVALFLTVLAIGLTLLWVGCRGRFIFLDGIVRNRAAIVEPWKEFRKEGNRLFGLHLVAGLVFLACLLPVILVAMWVALGGGEKPHFGFLQLVPMIVFMIIFIGILFFWLLLRVFIVPLMYRQRCGATEALRHAWTLVRGRFGVCMLFALFYAVVILGVGIGMVLAMCLTCCITAIPYVSNVVYLPVSVTLTAFSLFFVRQFGPECDVWQSPRVVAAMPPALPVSEMPPPPPREDVPPVQG